MLQNWKGPISTQHSPDNGLHQGKLLWNSEYKDKRKTWYAPENKTKWIT